MAPRPANPEIKEKLVAAGQRLVLEQGFSATSIDQICREAGVTKGNFFHYFRSKQELGAELLHQYAAVRMAFLTEGPERAIADPRERLFAYMGRMIAASSDPEILRGCLMGNLGQELSQCNPELREIIAAGLAGWVAFAEKDLAEAKRLYAPRAGWEPAAVARHLIAVFQGGLLLVRISGEADALRSSLEQFVAYLESLLGRPKTRPRVAT